MVHAHELDEGLSELLLLEQLANFLLGLLKLSGLLLDVHVLIEERLSCLVSESLYSFDELFCGGHFVEWLVVYSSPDLDLLIGQGGVHAVAQIGFGVLFLELLIECSYLWGDHGAK